MQSKKIPITSQRELAATHGNTTLAVIGPDTWPSAPHSGGCGGLPGGRSVEANWEQKPFKS